MSTATIIKPNGKAPELNVSLEPHLIQALIPLLPLLPSSLATELSPYLSTETLNKKSSPTTSTIPYNLLHSISHWSRTSPGISTLHSASPPLEVHDYSMIALLAGTTTSPERKFASYVPPKEPEDVEKERARERKAITTLVNGLLSVGGSGAAAWWASASTGWRDEWVCFPFLCISSVCMAQHAHLNHLCPTESPILPTRRPGRSNLRNSPVPHLAVASRRPAQAHASTQTSGISAAEEG